MRISMKSSLLALAYLRKFFLFERNHETTFEGRAHTQTCLKGISGVSEFIFVLKDRGEVMDEGRREVVVEKGHREKKVSTSIRKDKDRG